MKLLTTSVAWLLVASLSCPLGAQPPAGQPDPQLDAVSDKLNSGDFVAALQLLEALEVERGGLPQHLAGLKGALALETGDPAKALATLEPLASSPEADPAVLYNAGRAALALGQTDTGIQWLERSLDLVPDSPAARDLGLVWTRMGRYRDAYRLLRPWAREDPQDTEARLAAALCAVQLERSSEAEEFLSDLDQNDPKVRMLWGKVLLDKADPYGAIATLKPLVENPPPTLATDLFRTLADAYAAVGQADEAVRLLEGRVSGNPSMALQLALAQYQSGDLEGATATLQPFAQTALDKLTGAGPTTPGIDTGVRIIVEYGRLLATAGRHADALPYLERATQLAPDNKQSWHQLGQAYAATGRSDEARVALERFQQIVKNEVPAAVKDVQLERDLEDPTGRELRDAMKLFADGDSDEALAIVRQEAELAPSDPRPLYLEARFLLMTDRADEALQAAHRAIELAPDNADGFYIRGTVMMGMRDFPAAEADYRRALELYPDHTATMNDFAVLLMDQGRDDEARRLLQRALELQPDDSLAAANLERLGGG